MNKKLSDQWLAMMQQSLLIEDNANNQEKTIKHELQNDISEVTKLHSELVGVNQTISSLTKEYEEEIEIILYLQQKSDASKDKKIQIEEQIRILEDKEKEIRTSSASKVNEILKKCFEFDVDCSAANINKKCRAAANLNIKLRTAIALRENKLEKLNQEYNGTFESIE